MDLLFSVVNNKFNVIDEPEQSARELDMEVCGSFFDYHRPFHPLDDLLKGCDGISCSRSIGERRDSMGCISALDRDTVRAVRTGG